MAGRTVLITGAGSGIGRAFAETLAAAGDALVLLDVDARGLAATVESVARTGVAVAHASADIADRGALEATIAALLAKSAGLDLLINCAAILGPGTWSTQAADEFERVLRIDLAGTANTIRACLPWLTRARGHIVNLASTAAVHGWPGLAAYSAAKFGVTGFSDAIRPELARDGVTLTTVFPLLIDTPLLDRPELPPILRQGRRIPASAVVRKVLRAVARRRARVYIPGTVRLIAALHGIAPSLLDRYGTWFGLERAPRA
jgi:NAD(P)-dependent dehydrogenase (short-subunit alcohol dehydrogenase family)